MDQKKYMDIQVLKPAISDGFRPGDHIVVQEKIDGANFSIRYDESDGTIKAFSRRKALTPLDTLRGAWNWAQNLDPEKIKSVLGGDQILFMEWLVSHTVKYPEDCYKKAYCYDIYDTATKKYLPQDIVKQKVDELGLTYVPVFYDGDFTSWDHLLGFVGKTNLGGEYGEGIVVKNQTRLNSENEYLPFYTKIVADKFRETKGHSSSKVVDPAQLLERERVQEITSSIVTEARVRKLLNKMVDDGIIPEDWDEHHMSTIAKTISKEVYYDCVKEEPDTVKEAGELFGKFASSTSMRIVKDILKERNSFAA